MKKIGLVIIMIVLLATVANAASVNGDYKGNPIVKVRVDGVFVDSEVPGIIFDGSTLVPLRAVTEAMGGTISWNRETYTADINSSYVEENDTQDVVNTINKNIVEHNGTFASYTIDTFGTYVSIRLDGSGDTNEDRGNLLGLFLDAEIANADEIIISYYNYGTYINNFKIDSQHITDLIDERIDFTKYESLVKVENLQVSTGQSILDGAQTTNRALCELINENYDRAISEVEISLGKRGIGDSSSLDSNKKYFNELRNKELIENGCPTL